MYTHNTTLGLINVVYTRRYMPGEYMQRLLTAGANYGWRTDEVTKQSYWAHKSVSVATVTGVSEHLMLLPSDAEMSADPRFRRILEELADDADRFDADFAEAMGKLLALGVPTPNDGPDTHPSCSKYFSRRRALSACRLFFLSAPSPCVAPCLSAGSVRIKGLLR